MAFLFVIIELIDSFSFDYFIIGKICVKLFLLINIVIKNSKMYAISFAFHCNNDGYKNNVFHKIRNRINKSNYFYIDLLNSLP